MAIDATPGGVAADSYATLSEANAYFSKRLGVSAWEALADTDKERALKHATIQIDRLEKSAPLRGVRMNTAQALAFPRAALCFTTDVPVEVKRACFEEALWAVRNSAAGGTSQRQLLQAQGVQEFTVDGFSESFAGASFADIGLCPDARAWLKPWVLRVGEVQGEREHRECWDGVVNRD